MKAFYILFYSILGKEENSYGIQKINKSMCLLNDIDDCIQSVILFVVQFGLNAFLSMNSVCIFAYLSLMLLSATILSFIWLYAWNSISSLPHSLCPIVIDATTLHLHLHSHSFSNRFVWIVWIVWMVTHWIHVNQIRMGNVYIWWIGKCIWMRWKMSLAFSHFACKWKYLEN